MIEALIGMLGGLGLFLLGMAIMTDGLKSFAGDALRLSLARFTHSPLSGAATGAISTAALQSSSATTVMAVGFAGAGLLTFAQALGIIFGANIGTTITGWLVALFGFKFDLAEVVMPLIFAGAMLRLLGGRRISAGGFTLAGFGLIFAGISTLQVAMEGASDFITPESFPPDTFTGRIWLVVIGIGITLVTQSSSAGVATAITAVHVGTISLSQAGAMVIGMDVGTTFTAALATVGGTVSAQRTGIAHVVYNVMTAVGAFIMLPWFIEGWHWLTASAEVSDPEIALVAFHTVFNGLGVLAVLPLTHQFAWLIERLIPIELNEMSRRLEPSLLSQSSVAIAAVHSTLQEIVSTVFQSLSVLIDDESDKGDAYALLDKAEKAVVETQQYIGRIQTSQESADVHSELARSLHMIDHSVRLIRRARMSDRLRTVHSDNEMRAMAKSLASVLRQPITDDQSYEMMNNQLDTLWKSIDQKMESVRRKIISRSTDDVGGTNRTIANLDAFRWLRRVSYHALRISVHLNAAADTTIGPAAPVDAIEDDPDMFLHDGNPQEVSPTKEDARS